MFHENAVTKFLCIYIVLTIFCNQPINLVQKSRTFNNVGTRQLGVSDQIQTLSDASRLCKQFKIPCRQKGSIDI